MLFSTGFNAILTFVFARKRKGHYYLTLDRKRIFSRTFHTLRNDQRFPPPHFGQVFLPFGLDMCSKWECTNHSNTYSPYTFRNYFILIISTLSTYVSKEKCQTINVQHVLFFSLSFSLSTNCPSSMAHICTYIFFSRLIFVETRTVFFLVSFDREYCDRSQRVIKRVVQERRQRRLKNLLFAVR